MALFVARLTPSVTEPVIREAFEQFGKLTRVTMRGTFAFVEFENRECADRAIEGLNGLRLSILFHSFLSSTNPFISR
jgi:RNA recognition motif-containing protein